MVVTVCPAGMILPNLTPARHNDVRFCIWPIRICVILSDGVSGNSGKLCCLPVKAEGNGSEVIDSGFRSMGLLTDGR